MYLQSLSYCSFFFLVSSSDDSDGVEDIKYEIGPPNSSIVITAPLQNLYCDARAPEHLQDSLEVSRQGKFLLSPRVSLS